LPPEQVPAVNEVQQFVTGADAGNATDQTVLILSIVMAGEECKRIGRVAHDRQDGLNGDVSEDVVRRHPARHRRCRVAPDIQRELL